MSILQKNKSEDVSAIEIGGNNNDVNKNLLENDNIELDITNELITVEKQYKDFLKLLDELNKTFEEVSENYDKKKFNKHNLKYKNFKKKLELVNQNLKILQETSKGGADQEIKNLYNNINFVYEKVQKASNEVDNKIFEITSKHPDSTAKNKIKIPGFNIEIDDEKTPLESNTNNEFLEVDENSNLSGRQIELQKITKHSTDIKNLTSEIHQELNNEKDLSKLEYLLSDTPKKNSKKFEIYDDKEDSEEDQQKTKTYLIACCVGSVLLFTLMILLKYVINKSHSAQEVNPN